MAHYSKPATGVAAAYDVDNKLAPGSIWRMRIPAGGRRDVELCCANGLWIKSTNPSVVPQEQVKEHAKGDVRVLSIFGRAAGLAELEAGQGSGAWIRLQIQVVDAKQTSAPNEPYFVIPKDGDPAGCKTTAQGHLWRVELEKGEVTSIGLKLGPGLKLTVNNPAIVEVGAETILGDTRKFKIAALNTGDANIEARNANGAVVTHIQVHVNPPTPDYGIIAQGPEAARKAIQLMETSRSMPDPVPYPSQFGPVAIKRGTIWSGDRMIVHAGHQFVIYLSGDKLMKYKTADFVREIWLNGLADGANKAKHMVTVSKVVMSLATGLLVGVGVSLTGKVIVTALWASAHEDLVNRGINAARPAFRLLDEFRTKYPTLWSKLMSAAGAGLKAGFWDALQSAVTDPQSIAFFIGRILKGFPSDPGASAVKLFVKIALLVAKCAALVTATHMPAGYIHAGHAKVGELAGKIKAGFAADPALGITVTALEATTIARELAAQPDTQQRLDALKVALDGFLPMLQQFEKDMRDMQS